MTRRRSSGRLKDREPRDRVFALIGVSRTRKEVPKAACRQRPQVADKRLSQIDPQPPVGRRKSGPSEGVDPFGLKEGVDKTRSA